MSKDYNHKEIEKKWQDKWQKEGIYDVENKVEGKENFYSLTEFSYPSGNLHVGHWYAFSVPDFYARYKRMNGFNVLYPVGYDSFGLPAENAAIKNNKDPKVWTEQNMQYMKGQLERMGAMFDWKREVSTSSPEYYKWTQWMFNEFFKNDLAYRATTKVNYCPSCKTVLANEQVVNGECERCGSEVEQKDQDQWSFRITKFADDLIDDLDGLDWPNEIKTSQKAWIGRSEGAEITFKTNTDNEIKAFTTRPDTLFGVTYMVLAPEHEFVQKFEGQIQNIDEVKDYIQATKKKSELDRLKGQDPSTGSGQGKTGVELKGVKAVNPANGEEIPVWIADYVLVGYGTGAIMAVPAHDERDSEFAEKFDLPFKNVVAIQIGDRIPGATYRLGVSAIVRNKDGNILVQTNNHKRGFLYSLPGGGVEDGELLKEALRREIEEETGYVDFDINDCIGSYEYNFNSPERGYDRRLTEYLFNVTLNSDKNQGRQLTEKESNIIQDDLWVSFDEASDLLEKSTNFCGYGEFVLMKNPNFTGKGVLVNSGEFTGLTSEEAKIKITEKVGGVMKKTYRLRDWGISRQRYWGCPIPIVYDPKGKAHPVPSEHLPWLLPEDVDHTPDGTAPLARSKELRERTEKIFGEGWKPEVETMDTFVDSSWYFYRYLDSKNEKEFSSKEAMDSWMPIDSYSGGAEHTTMHLLYSRFWVKALHSLGFVKNNEPYKNRYNRGLILGPDGNKMSKSKGNVIDPDAVVENVGADTVRMYLAFMGPYGVTANYPWNPDGVVGIRRFLERVLRVSEKLTDEKTPDLESLVHKTIKRNGEDFERMKFNTAISNLMVLNNAFEKAESVNKDLYKVMIQLLSPMAPHLSEEIWRETLGESESVHIQSWPAYDEKLLIEDVVTMAVQVSGKVRGEIEIAPDAQESVVTELALQDENVQKFLDGRDPKKVIYIPGKILNIVV